jgi:hypothetical protein
VTSAVTINFSEAMSREAAQNAFSLSGLSGSFAWDPSQKIVTFNPASALNYLTTYNVTVGATAADLAGNGMAAAFSSAFTTAQSSDREKPKVIIQSVDPKGNATTLKDGDYISKTPKLRGIITDNLAVDGKSIKFYLDNALVTATITRINDAKYQADYEVTKELEDEKVMTHKVRIEANDTALNTGTGEVKNLKVSYSSPGIIGPIISYPPIFRPLIDPPVKFVYTLTGDADVMIFMFDVSGQNVWTARCAIGTMGGRAGYNEVPFDGRSDLGGYLGNGIYVFRIVANNHVIGTGHVLINDSGSK